MGSTTSLVSQSLSFPMPVPRQDNHKHCRIACTTLSKAMAQWVQWVPPWQYTTYGARNGPSALNSAVLPSMNVPFPKMTSSPYPGVIPASMHYALSSAFSMRS